MISSNVNRMKGFSDPILKPIFQRKEVVLDEGKDLFYGDADGFGSLTRVQCGGGYKE